VISVYVGEINDKSIGYLLHEKNHLSKMKDDIIYSLYKKTANTKLKNNNM